MLALAGTVAEFALASDPECVLGGETRLAPVQAGIGPGLHVGIEEPVDDEERPFDPSDLAEGGARRMLARSGCERSRVLAGRNGAVQGAREAQATGTGLRSVRSCPLPGSTRFPELGAKPNQTVMPRVVSRHTKP